MIISASRRTDIPAFYSDWLLNRLNAGYVLTRNPFNNSQVSKIPLSTDVVDCIVFWTKNPRNMFDKLNILDELGYKYYFQFTLTPYDKTIERGLHDKEEIIKTFCELSGRLGKEKVLWRYDPIILNDKYDIDYHKRQFEKLCSKLHNKTSSCTISFVDMYAKLKMDILREINEREMLELCGFIASTAKSCGIQVKSCCEKLDFSMLGVEKAHCIDRNVIEKVCGYSLDIKKDKSQRTDCGCYESIDIGAYNTCRHGCVYCYANYSSISVENNCMRHDVNGELLVGKTGEEENIRTRAVKLFKR